MENSTILPCCQSRLKPPERSSARRAFSVSVCGESPLLAGLALALALAVRLAGLADFSTAAAAGAGARFAGRTGNRDIQPSSLTQGEDYFGGFVDRISLDQAVAVNAVDSAAARVEQAQVVVDFCGGGYGGARIASGVLLLDGDGRGEAIDFVHVGLFNALEKLARVGGERLDVPALPFGVDGVEG